MRTEYDQYRSDGSRHDEGLIDFLHEYGFEDYLLKVKYSDSERFLGEIDAYAMKDDELYLIEYKATTNKTKRRKGWFQLLRAYDHARIAGIDTHLLLVGSHDYYNHMIVPADTLAVYKDR